MMDKSLNVLLIEDDEVDVMNVQRAFKKNSDRVEMIWPENYTKRSQDLDPTFHDAGQFYWCKTKDFLASRELFGDDTVGFEVSELEVQDIDNLLDWEIAELKYQKAFGK